MAFRLGDGRLLLLGGDDNPFDEVLTIALRSPDGRRLALRRIGGPYTSGWLDGARVLGPRRLAFGFPDKVTQWQLDVAGPGWPAWLPSATMLRLRKLPGLPRRTG